MLGHFYFKIFTIFLFSSGLNSFGSLSAKADLQTSTIVNQTDPITLYVFHSKQTENQFALLVQVIESIKSQAIHYQIEVVDSQKLPHAALKRLLQKENSCALALESLSLSKILATRTKTPIFAINIPKITLDNQIKKYRQFNVALSGIYQEQSFERQLILAKVIDSDFDSAATILGQNSRYSLKHYQEISSNHSLNLEYEILQRNSSPNKFIEKLAGKKLFLATVNDSQHYSTQNLKTLLVTGHKWGIPIIGNKRRDGKLAAMATVFTKVKDLAIESVKELGAYCNNKSLVETKTSILKARYSEHYSVFINQTIAKNFGYNDLVAEKLIKAIYLEENKLPKGK